MIFYISMMILSLLVIITVLQDRKPMQIRQSKTDCKTIPRLTNLAVCYKDKLIRSLEERVSERAIAFTNQHPEQAVDIDKVEIAYFQVINEEAERLNRSPD